MGIKGDVYFSVLLCITAFGVEITPSQNITQIVPLRQMIVSNNTIFVGGAGGIAVLERDTMKKCYLYIFMERYNERFLESRKLKLRCENTAIDGQYFESTLWQNDHVNCSDTGDNVCNKENKSDICEVLQGNFCSTRYHHTLVGGKGITTMDHVYDINKIITAMDLFLTEDYTVLYFGTSDGQAEGKCPRLDDDVELHLFAYQPENLTIRVREFESNVIDKLSSSNFTCEISQNGIIVKASRVLWDMNYTHFTCMDYSRFSCITGEVSEPNNGKITMSFKGCPSPIVKNTYFTYRNPGDIQNFYPRKGILAGNTTLTITGQNISFEGPDRYNIKFCDENSVTCIECRILDSVNMNDSKIMCKTGESNEPRNLTKLVVVIDSLTTLQLTRTFQYLPDPTFDISNETLKAIESGGATFTINGDGFNNVGQITVERVDEPCEVPSDKQAVCQTPEKLPDQPNVQTVIVNFDGIPRAFEINYVDDPSFERFDSVIQYDKESSITIMGKNILNGARFDDYNILVGLDGKCLISEISDITMDFIKCVPPKNVPRTNKSDVNTVHVIVVVGKITAYIGDLQYKEDDNQFSLIVGLLTGGLVTSIIIGFTAVFISRRSKKRFMVKCKMEMSKALSERRENSGNNDELRDIEGNEMAYSEINPAAELNSNTNRKGHQDVQNEYENSVLVLLQTLIIGYNSRLLTTK
ncbi:unnamed protein product [Mytilus edulis]|uniref:IPT/TIG domain-containing protein n=1 Tax=Mytilus edulis TaxID=6550 RepID=A0A8S3R3L0_MYTED|nr:unnamed protein product [Mytilus edulis]